MRSWQIFLPLSSCMRWESIDATRCVLDPSSIGIVSHHIDQSSTVTVSHYKWNWDIVLPQWSVGTEDFWMFTYISQMRVWWLVSLLAWQHYAPFLCTYILHKGINAVQGSAHCSSRSHQLEADTYVGFSPVFWGLTPLDTNTQFLENGILSFSSSYFSWKLFVWHLQR